MPQLFQDKQSLKKHLEYCKNREAVKISLPEQGTILF